jgi:protein-S-isoprenylcysteine O-methyltransferase Ste14
MPNSLEMRFRAISARTAARRTGVIVLALFVLTYLAMIAPELFHAPSHRRQIALAVAWCLGVAALLMLVRLWRHITRDAVSAPRVGV